ncbi:MAG: M61 family metallopeptidase, partial [Acidobacteriaceae bacterium]|nr:M61 family metallopeptidase [Acidobacteriaceae bacterium]
QTVDYHLSLANRGDHLVRVEIHLPAGAPERTLQLPVWNALYQVRDFAQFVREVSGTDPSESALEVRKVDKCTWRVSGTDRGATVRYSIVADTPGPFGAELNPEHAFFNLAEILMYAVDARASPVTINFRDVPPTWTIATALLPSGVSASTTTFSAKSYDRLVDAPVEIANFSQTFIREGGATYRIVVHADPADFNMADVANTVRRVVATEVEWMKDRPFDEYLFIIHFPRGAGGGGMEHAYSSAIEIPAGRLKDDPLAFTGLVAHEFFHLWNVKRIRPQSLEPVDYTRENYTTALWFSEGVTDAVQDLILLRMGAVDESRWLRLLARSIREFEERPAHLRQSAEESSLDAWLEKYPDYRLPERSVSYYNKGELLGILLDLAVRDASHGQKSIRNVMQWMNRNFAQKDRPFPDSAGVRQAAEAVTGTDFSKFFDSYVSGVSALPYNEYLQTVGLRLERQKVQAPYAGFEVVRNFDAAPVVGRVDSRSDAARLGLESGDTILKINGKAAMDSVQARLGRMRVGENVKLRVAGRSGQRDMKIKLTGREEDEFQVVNLDAVSAEQRARRAAWLNGEEQGPSNARGTVRAHVEGASVTPPTTSPEVVGTTQ